MMKSIHYWGLSLLIVASLVLIFQNQDRLWNSLLENGLVKAPTYQKVHPMVQKANEAARKGLLETELRAMEGIAEVLKDNPEVFYRVGLLNLKLDHPEEAIDALRKAAGHLPESPSVWGQLGLAYLDVKDYQNTIKAWERASTLEPDDGNLSYLARLTAEDLATLDTADLSRFIPYELPQTGPAMLQELSFQAKALRFNKGLSIIFYFTLMGLIISFGLFKVASSARTPEKRAERRFMQSAAYQIGEKSFLVAAATKIFFVLFALYTLLYTSVKTNLFFKKYVLCPENLWALVREDSVFFALFALGAVVLWFAKKRS